MAADTDPIQPIHEPAVPFLDEEASWVRDAADRFEGARAEELLAWALDTFHPRIAISAAGGADGLALMDMAGRSNPHARVFTLDTGRQPPAPYAWIEQIHVRVGSKM